MSGDIGIGRLIGAAMPARDAVHIAVAPVTLAQNMAPGDNVKLREGSQTTVVLCDQNERIGVIDPFLTQQDLPAGTRCWLFLVPGSITSLRHDWSHTAFKDAPAPAKLSAFTEKEKAEAEIARFANICDQTVSRIMNAADTWVEYEEYTYDNSESYKEATNEDWSRFWAAWSVVTGRKVPKRQYGNNFFTCSC